MRCNHPARPAILLMGLLLMSCQPAPTSTGHPSPAASIPAPSPTLAVRAPADAVLDDASVGLPRTAGRDHLSASEAARDQSDEVLALEAFSGFGWADASTRRWAAGGRTLADLVVVSESVEGAGRAFAYWMADASRAPLVAGACPPEVAGLDRCAYGSGAGRSVLVGSLAWAVFRIEGDSADVARMAPVQAGRLRT